MVSLLVFVQLALKQWESNLNEQIRAIYEQTNLHRNDHTTEQREAEVNFFATLLINDIIRVLGTDIVKMDENMDQTDVDVVLLEHYDVDYMP